MLSCLFLLGIMVMESQPRFSGTVVHNDTTELIHSETTEGVGVHGCTFQLIISDPDSPGRLRVRYTNDRVHL